MRALPYLQCDFLPKEELYKFEYSDRLMISDTLFKSLGVEQAPLLLSVTNPCGGFVAGTLFNLHTNESVVYMPSWMISILNITNNVQVRVIERVPCTRLMMRPHNSELFSIPDWNTKFSEAIQYYNTLTIGTKVPIVIGGVYMYVTIELINDKKYTTYFLDNGAEIDLEILTPLESKQERSSIPYLYKKPGGTPTAIYAFSGRGHAVGGTARDPSLSKREQVENALLTRLGLKKNES